MSGLITLEDMQRAMPTRSNAITQQAVDIINDSRNDPEFQGETLLKTAATYENILKGTKASIPEYLNAVRFCAYMMTNNSNYTEAYKKVFLDRKFVKDRLSLPTDDPRYAELTSAASRYRRTKLVVDILTVSQVPLDLIFSGYRYKAIGVLANTMETARYDRDKINAAKELLAATKGAENIKMELEVGVAGESALQQMNDQLASMAARQRDLLTSGASDLGELGAIKTRREEKVIEGEYSSDS